MRKKGLSYKDPNFGWQFTQKWKCKYCQYTEMRLTH